MNQNKNIKLTIVATALLVIGVFVNDTFKWFDDNYQNAKLLMPKFNLDTVAKIKLNRSGKDIYSFTKNEENWFISESTSKTAKANAKNIEKNLKKFNNMRQYREITSSEAKFKQFGVSANDFSVELLTSDNTPIAKIFLGKKGPGPATTIVRMQKDNVAYAVTGSLKPDWEKSFNQFRDRTILKFNKANLESFKVSGVQNYIIERDKATWKINLYGSKKAGNKPQIDNIINSLANLQGSSFDVKNTILRKYGNIEVTLSSKVNLKLEVFGPGPGKVYIAKSSMLKDYINIAEYKVKSIFEDSKKLIQQVTPPKKK